jgi:hypothetical protein
VVLPTIFDYLYNQTKKKKKKLDQSPTRIVAQMAVAQIPTQGNDSYLHQNYSS